MKEKLKTRHQKRLRAKKLAHLYGLLTIFVFSFYFAAGFFLHPLFLVSDIREKIRAVAGTVTVLARVLDAPIKPIVTGTGMCVSGGPSIILDWADDGNSVSYDITRDGLPLTTGVIVSDYTDTTVVLGQTYSYVVTALGPMGPGFNDADPVSVTVPSECTPSVVPNISLQTFAGNHIAGTTERHFTTDRNPRLTGVTNISNARVELTIRSGSDTIRSTVFANVNGYFEWSYGGKLDVASYDITVTAINQSDPTISASEKLKIGIQAFFSQTDQGNGVSVSGGTSTDEKPIQIRPDFDFSVRLAGRELYAGGIVHSTVEWQRLPDQLIGTQGTAFFQLIDGNGKTVDQSTQPFVFDRNLSLEQSFVVPYGMVDKNYRVKVEVRIPSYRVTHEESIRVLPLPLLQLGGMTVSYEQAVGQLGWISFLLLFLFLWWLLLFLREYFLYLQSVRFITGKDLHTAGYF